MAIRTEVPTRVSEGHSIRIYLYHKYMLHLNCG